MRLTCFGNTEDEIAFRRIATAVCSRHQGMRIEASDSVSSASSPFGQNEWLVEEMYRKFRDDPASVDRVGTSSRRLPPGTHRPGT